MCVGKLGFEKIVLECKTGKNILPQSIQNSISVFHILEEERKSQVWLFGY